MTKPQVAAPLVLIVDDDAELQVLFSHALTRAGFATRTAGGGRDALAALARDDVALVLLDSQMPGMSGAQVLAAIRSDPAYAAVPVIIVTGDGEERARVAGLDRGADDYLVKPVSLRELVARVRAQLRGRTLWSAATFARELRARARIADEISALAADAGAGALPGLLCDAFREFLDAEAVAIVLSSDGVTLAASHGDPPVRRAEWLTMTRDALAAYLQRRAPAGPWVRHRTGRGTRGLAGEDSVFVPIPIWRREGETRPVLVVTFGPPDDAEDEATWQARRLAAVIDLAAVSAGILGPQLLDSGDAGRQRDLLRALIAADAFTTHFQPITALDGSGVAGYEALTRFTDGSSPQARFTQAAALGLAGELEEATLRRALALGRGLPADAWLSLNVSPALLTDAALLRRLVDEAGRPVVVEVTEQEAIDDYPAVLASLASAGPDVRLAVDDAGAGHASLRHILRLRPEFVKLDMTLVRDVDRDPSREAMVAGLVHFGEATDSLLIAEGVEREGELDALRDLRVPLAQGYLVGRPEAVAG